MVAPEVIYEFRFQRGTSTSWEEKNLVLGSGEPGVEVDTGKFKVGDGHTPWNDLDYFLTEPQIEELVHYGAAFYVPFGRNGDLITFTGPRLYLPEDSELLEAMFSVTTAPVGSPAIFDILKNGVPIFASGPTIDASSYLSSAGTLIEVTTFDARTDYLQVQCTQVGSITPGANLSVVLKMIPV